MRFYNLVTSKGLADEPGSTNGQPLRGLGMAMNIANMTVPDVLVELEKLQVKGTPTQFSRMRRGLQPLTLIAELRLMEIFGLEKPEDLVNPQYSDEDAAKVKAIYKRNLST